MRGCQVLFIIIGAPIVAFVLLVAYAKFMIVTGNTSMQAQHAATGPIVIMCAVVMFLLFMLLLRWQGESKGKQ